MKRIKIIYDPYVNAKDSTNLYMNNMMSILRTNYEVVRWYSISTNVEKLREVKAIILNWTEAGLTEEILIKLLLCKCLGVKIVWVFHNNGVHNAKNAKGRRNTFFLACFASNIVLHNQASVKYLPFRIFNKRKCTFVPLPHYIENYSQSEILEVEHTQEGILTFSIIGAISPYKNIEILIRVSDGELQSGATAN